MTTSSPSCLPPSPRLRRPLRAQLSPKLSPARAALLAWGAPLALSAGLSFSSVGELKAQPPGVAPQEATQEAPQKGQRVMDVAPLPKTRGFWGTFFFWSGGVLAMYLVGKRVFREQSHERRTLKLFQDQIGPFFPEFEPKNLRTWLDIAAPHLYAGWRAGDLSGMLSFSEAAFVERENERAAQLKAQGRRRQAHFGAMLNMHPLGAYLLEGEEVPPKGVELQLRVELKVIDFLEGEGGLVVGEKKHRQVQQLWILRHNGATWRVHDISALEGDVVGLDERPELPPIMSWVRPEGVRVTTELSQAQIPPKSLPPLPLSTEPLDEENHA